MTRQHIGKYKLSAPMAFLVVLLLGVGAWRAQAYSFWSTQDLTQSNWPNDYTPNWTISGALTTGSGGVVAYDNGETDCGAAWANYNAGGLGEIALTVSWQTGSGGAASILLSGDSNTDAFPYVSGRYVEIDYEAYYSYSGNLEGNISVNYNNGGTQYGVSGGSFTPNPGQDVISVLTNGTTEGVYVNGNLVTSFAVPGNQFYGYYGFGTCSQAYNYDGAITAISIGPRGGYPNSIPASEIGVSAFYNKVDLQWPAATESDPEVGILEYQVYRNGSLLGTTNSLAYSDSTVNPYTTYTYTLSVVDQFFNTASTNVTVNVPPVGPPQSPTNPPYPSTLPEGRRVGVRTTGAYWGASGENIDVLSGNLSFSQPLLSAQGRSGWSVGFNLIYNSQNWRKDSGGIWEFNADVGYGYGWRLMPGAIEPVYNSAGTMISSFVFIDGTGAEYILNQQNGTIWSSQQSTYVWWDSYGLVLHFRDGSAWTFDCVSASNQPDAGFMYPTQIEDPNGNQVLISYNTAPGASWANSTARISSIADVRATEPEGTYYTYAFNYNTDSPPHLTSITNSIGTGEAYNFSYTSAQTLEDPFTNGTHSSTKFLETATITNIGTYYQFTTDAYGELTEIQLPYKGTLQYAYTTTTYGDGKAFRELNTRTLSTCNSAGQGCESGSGQYTISHESSPGYDVHQYTLIEDPGGVGEKYWAFNSSGSYEGLTTTYQGRDRNAGGPGNCLSGNTTGSGACKVENDYTWTQDSANNSYISQVLDTLDPGQSYAVQSSTTQTMNSYGNVTQVVNNNFSGYSPSARTTNYAYLNSSNYTSRYIYNRLTSAAETDGTTNLTLATITYDCGNGCVGSGYSPNPRQWDTNFTTVGYRGNPTTTVTLSGTSTATYDLYGNATAGTNNNGVSSTASTTSATNYAAPVEITVGGSLTTSLSYASFLGPTSETGPNGTTVDIGYDANARPTSSTSPFGAVTTTAYNDTASPPNSCTMVDGRWTQTNLDGLGRPILTLTGYGSSCGPASGTTLTQAETTYGPCGCTPVGKMVSQAVPHTYGTQASATTTYTYDGVGRTLSKAVVGSETQGTTSYSYQGNTTTVTDPASTLSNPIWKTYTTDAFGNLVQVAEPNPYSGSNYLTSYTYDVLNHLTNVSMPRSTGTQTRSWTYSGTFLMSATNPENGTVSYTYGSNQKVATRTDAKGQVTAYTYDSMARLAEVQHYPNGISNGEDVCQQVDYYYDGYNPLNSNQAPYSAGLLSAVQYYSSAPVPSAQPNPTCYTTFTEMYAYGMPGAPIGKQLTVTRDYDYTVGSTNYSENLSVNLAAGYTYDSEGRLTNIAYPTDSNGTTANLSYTFDSMGRLNTMTDNNEQIIQGATYGPANELLSMTGIPCCSPGWSNGETYTYNSLKQLTSVSAGSSLSVSYSYPSTGNNGKISSQTDNISGETVTYTYDSLKRLATAENSGASPSWGQGFTYDGFGNLTQTNVIQGSAPTLTASYNANNQVGNEDANGNPPLVPLPASGGTAQPTYDVENRLVQLYTIGVPNINYNYDPANHRVWRSNPATSTDEITFWSITGQKLGTYQLTYTASGPSFTCVQTATNLYFGGKLIKDNNGYVYPDRLGSIGKFYPYGIERPSATTNGTEKFTGYFRDSESGNDYAVNRYQSPGYGRFLTPDRGGAHFASPGTWNKYAYAGGDPINHRDPSGRDFCLQDDPTDCVSDEDCATAEGLTENPAAYAAFCEQGISTDGGGDFGGGGDDGGDSSGSCYASNGSNNELVASPGQPSPNCPPDAQQLSSPPPAPPGPSCSDLLTEEISSFLGSRGSPLADDASTIVMDAQSNDINPYLLVAISGAESTFGTSPTSQATYNAFGLMHRVRGTNTYAVNNYSASGSWAPGIAAAAALLKTQIFINGNDTVALLYSGQMGAYCVTAPIHGVRPPCTNGMINASAAFMLLSGGEDPEIPANLLWPCP